MKLDSHITSEFSDMINELYSEPTEQTVYGVAKEMTGGSGFGVLLDGAENPIPVESAVTLSDDDRVQVVIQNHKATVVANMTDKVVTETKAEEVTTSVATTVIKEYMGEAKMKYITYTNSGNISITDGGSSKRAAYFHYETDELTWINSCVQIQCNVTDATDDCIVTATLKIDNNTITLSPVETWKNGSHIFTINYLYSANVPDGGTYEVLLSCEGGNVTIPSGQSFGYISSVALTTSDNPFDGTLRIDDEFTNISIPNTSVNNYLDSITVDTPNKRAKGYSDNYSLITIPGMNIVEYSATVNPEDPMIQMIIDYRDNYRMIYNRKYVKINDNNKYVLNTNYEYSSQEETIDEGRMTTVEINTDDFQSTESMVITNE